VEDSLVYQEYYQSIFLEYSEIQIVGIVSTGEEALDHILQTKPDVILMDFVLPNMDGLATTKKIMEKYPTPIIIVSAMLHRDNIANTFSALEVGAMALIEKPESINTPDGKQQGKDLVDTILQIANAKLFKHKRSAESKRKTEKIPQSILEFDTKRKTIEYVIIGSSTGGPDVLQRIFMDLPSTFPLPILVVQHIANGFVLSLVNWLKKTAKLKIEIAKEHEIVKPGCIYFAPDHFQMGITLQGKILLEPNRGNSQICPSIAYLFSSFFPFAQKSIAILLTGMGRDGAMEMLELKEKGAITIIQNEESSVIYGMPFEAKKLNAQCIELSPEEIAENLKKWIS